MIKRKIAMIGAFAVGKTSLVEKFVHSIFSEKYHTTVGVKIDKKIVSQAGQQVALVIWDLQGQDDIHKVRLNYLRGAAGYLLVMDGTRPETLATGLDIQREIRSSMGELPFVTLVNKADLDAQWRTGETEMRELSSRGSPVLTTSARSGQGVEDAFQRLVHMILDRGDGAGRSADG